MLVPHSGVLGAKAVSAEAAEARKKREPAPGIGGSERSAPCRTGFPESNSYVAALLDAGAADLAGGESIFDTSSSVAANRASAGIAIGSRYMAVPSPRQPPIRGSHHANEQPVAACRFRAIYALGVVRRCRGRRSRPSRRRKSMPQRIKKSRQDRFRIPATEPGWNFKTSKEWAMGLEPTTSSLGRGPKNKG